MNITHKRSRLAVGFFFFLHGLCFSSWASRVPSLQLRLGLSEAALGTVLFASPLGELLSMPFVARLISRRGSRQVLTAAMALYAVTLVALGASQSAWQLAAAFFVFGIAGNTVNIAVNTQAVEVESLYTKSIMASFHGMWSLAGFGGAAIGAAMIALDVAPANHFLFIFVLALWGLAKNHAFLLEDPVSPQGEAASGRKFERLLLILGSIAFCSMICEGAMFDWSGVYFEKAVHVPKAWIGLGYTAFMSTMAGVRFLADGLKSRLGLQRLLVWSGAFTCTGFLLAVLFPYLPTAILGFLLIGMGVSSVVPMVISAAGKSRSLASSVAITLVSGIGFMGFFIGPPLIGWVAGATSLRVSFAIIAAMGLCIGVLGRKAPAV